MDTKNIRELSEKEIQVKIKDARDELLNLRLRKPTGQVEKPNKIRELRRLIARYETILREKLIQVELSSN